MTRAIGLLLMLPVLAGCAYDSALTSRAVVVQRKYDHLKCEQLEGEIKTRQAKVAELRGLIEKAQRASAGGLISATVYGPTLAEANGNLNELNLAYAEKNCEAEKQAKGR